MSFNCSPEKAKIKVEVVMKTYKLFIYGHIQCITNSFCKNVLKVVSILEEIKSRLKSGNACYHLVQNLLSSSSLSKK